MRVELTWSEFKTNVTNRSLTPQWYLKNDVYRVVAFDRNLTYSCDLENIAPVDADTQDFIDSYKDVWNQPFQSEEVKVESQIPFASKKIKVGGVEKSLFKRVHGVELSIADGQTGNIDFVVPHPQTKFTGAEIFGTDLGDEVDFTVHDDASNTYSGAPGSNYQLNQFGFNVKMPPDRYKNTSNYDADLYYGMIVRCAYTNNSGATKTVYMNVWLHEVK